MFVSIGREAMAVVAVDSCASSDLRIVSFAACQNAASASATAMLAAVIGSIYVHPGIRHFEASTWNVLDLEAASPSSFVADSSLEVKLKMSLGLDLKITACDAGPRALAANAGAVFELSAASFAKPSLFPFDLNGVPFADDPRKAAVDSLLPAGGAFGGKLRESDDAMGGR